MTFLDEIRTRLQDCQKRAQEITGRLQAVQLEHQSVMQELGSYQKIFDVENRRVQQQQQQTLPATTNLAVSQQPHPIVVSVEPSTSDEANKTEAIRELLRQHPAGMTPGQIWQVMKGQIAYRQYIYSVLKRLKDKKQVAERRGKYFFQVLAKPEEVREPTTLQ